MKKKNNKIIRSALNVNAILRVNCNFNTQLGPLHLHTDNGIMNQTALLIPRTVACTYSQRGRPS